MRKKINKTDQLNIHDVAKNALEWIESPAGEKQIQEAIKRVNEFTAKLDEDRRVNIDSLLEPANC